MTFGQLSELVTAIDTPTVYQCRSRGLLYFSIRRLAGQRHFGVSQAGKGVAYATPSPLSRQGRFLAFTGVRVSRTGRSRGNYPDRGTENYPATLEARRSHSESKPIFLKCFKRIRTLSTFDFRLNFMHRSRMRIHRSKLRYASPQCDQGVAK